MKRTFLTSVNALLTIVLAALGFGSCNMMKYGVPPDTELEVWGTVDAEKGGALEAMQVTVKSYGQPVMPRTYTNEEGIYRDYNGSWMGAREIDIIVVDPSGEYASDSAHISNIVYQKEKGADKETAVVRQDFHLKKK